GGEIVSVDSMQVYCGLDIGTAKPGPAERARVPHHLVDILNLNESFNAAEFVRRAESAIQSIQARGAVPLLCGGTGLYFNALIRGLGEARRADATWRRVLEEAAVEDLLKELAERDPATFSIIDRKNKRGVIRALEVIRLTDKPYSSQRTTWG